MMYQFSASHIGQPVRGVSRHNSLGEDRTRTAGLNWPKWCSIARDITWKNRNTVGSWLRGQPQPGDWLGISQQVVSNCVVHCLFWKKKYIKLLFLISFSILVDVFLILTYKFYLFSQFSLPNTWGERVNERLCDAKLPAGLSPSTSAVKVKRYSYFISLRAFIIKSVFQLSCHSFQNHINGAL